MSLTPEDVDTIARLLDQRIAQQFAQQEQRARRRRRWWFWLTILLLVASSVASWWWVKGIVQHMQGVVDATNREMLLTKVEYDRQLAHDRRMQQERAEAVRTSGYASSQSQSQFDAGLIRQALQLFNQTTTTRKHLASASATTAGGDEASDEQSLADLSTSLDQATGMVMQLLLHETDPAHQGRYERLANSDASGQKTVIQADPSVERPAGTPAPAPAADRSATAAGAAAAVPVSGK